ncbi:FecR family protein [Membranihabitans marinus]|uniref:FecR family protein n=1 Tax=Membranihabitans marinus TaxID=1227546 RepID=UPI001F2AA295|nr:FecR domain-containing protein [Membranihabitans marinus]
MQDNIKKRIFELYVKYLDQNISQREYEELFYLIGDERHKPIVDSIIDEAIEFGSLSNQKVKEDQGFTITRKELRPQAKDKKILNWTRISIAASILLLLATFTIIYYSMDHYVVYTTGYQETKNVELPDGSLIVMNARSELKWKPGFEKEEERIVYFKGEGYFDISHIDGKKFIVETEGIDVNVIGTEFNLESRQDITNVYLKEGKVVLKGDKIKPIEMVPGDLVTYDQRSNQVNVLSQQRADVNESWKDGLFTFMDKTGVQILEKMTDIYGKEFEIRDSSGLKDIIVVQGLPYADWDFTKVALELTLGVKLTESISNKIIVEKK